MKGGQQDFKATNLEIYFLAQERESYTYPFSQTIYSGYG